MTTAEEVIKATTTREENEKTPVAVRYFTPIFITFVLMAVALIYVWTHIYMTELEYQVADELSIKEQLLEEQKRLKLESATLKSPERIETIARNQLQMVYPDGKQVILLK
jgi:cell division protein FtsL